MNDKILKPEWIPSAYVQSIRKGNLGAKTVNGKPALYDRKTGHTTFKVRKLHSGKL